MNGRNLDFVLGAGATATGSTGITLQWALSFGNLTVLILNAAVAIGGLYLIRLRIKKAKRDLRE